LAGLYTQQRGDPAAVGSYTDIWSYDASEYVKLYKINNTSMEKMAAGFIFRVRGEAIPKSTLGNSQMMENGIISLLHMIDMPLEILQSYTSMENWKANMITPERTG